MGTHPIFESDFDCLTDGSREKVRLTMAKAPSLRKFAFYNADFDTNYILGRQIDQKQIDNDQLWHLETGQAITDLDKLKTGQSVHFQWPFPIEGHGDQSHFFKAQVTYVEPCVNETSAYLPSCRIEPSLELDSKLLEYHQSNVSKGITYNAQAYLRLLKAEWLELNT